MIVDVKFCRRCGCDHLQMEFTELTNPKDDWKFWAMCPVQNQPLLLRVVTPRTEIVIAGLSAQ